MAYGKKSKKFEKVGAGWKKEGENGPFLSIVIGEGEDAESYLLFPRDDDYYEEQEWEINENTPDFSVMKMSGDKKSPGSSGRKPSRKGGKSSYKSGKKKRGSVFGD